MGAYIDALTNKNMTHAQAVDYAEDVIERTQPVFSVKDVAEAYRSSEFWKMITMYTNQLNQNFNYAIHDVFGAARAGAIKKSEAVERLVLGLIVPAMLIGAIGRSRPADDLEELFGDISNQAVMALPMMGREMAAALKGIYGMSPPATLSLLEEGRNIVYYATVSKDWEKVLEATTQAGAYALGVPGISMKRTILNTWKQLADNAEYKSFDMWQLIVGEYVREEAMQDRKSWEEASYMINEAYNLLGKRDVEGKISRVDDDGNRVETNEFVDIGKFKEVVDRYTDKVDPNMMTVEMGFPAIVEEYMKAKPMFERYDSITSEGDFRRSERIHNPMLDVYLMIFRGYGELLTQEAQEKMVETVELLGIPLNAVPEYSYTKELLERQKKELRIKSTIKGWGS
jgi:hypothetical protein